MMNQKKWYNKMKWTNDKENNFTKMFSNISFYFKSISFTFKNVFREARERVWCLIGSVKIFVSLNCIFIFYIFFCTGVVGCVKKNYLRMNRRVDILAHSCHCENYVRNWINLAFWLFAIEMRFIISFASLWLSKSGKVPSSIST